MAKTALFMPRFDNLSVEKRLGVKDTLESILNRQISLLKAGAIYRTMAREYRRYCQVKRDNVAKKKKLKGN